MILTLLLSCSDAGVGKHNASPEARIVTPTDGAAYAEGDAVALLGSVTDDDGEATALTATWYADGVEICAAAAPASDGATTCLTTAPGADVEIRLDVLDESHASGSDRITLAITPSDAPAAAIVTPAAGDVLYSDQLVMLSGLVADAEDAPDTLDVVWWSSLEGDLALSPVPTSEGAVTSYTNLDEGAHAIELRVVDSTGKLGSASVIVDVGPPNTAPTCAITAPADGSAGPEATVVGFAATVGDADVPADWLAVTWTSDKDGAIGTSLPATDGSVSFPYADLTLDTHVVTLRVTDELGETCTDHVVYTVGSPPSVEILAPADGERFNEHDAITFLGQVSDAESTDLVLSWTSDLDGPLSAIDSFSAFLSVGEHLVTLEAVDPTGLSGTDSIQLTINGLPSAPGVSISPSAPRTDDELAATITSPSTDPEGDPLTYAYAWYRDGVLVASGATLSASETTKGETWTVTAIADDGYGGSDAGTDSVVIGNTAPSIAAVEITPDPANTTDDLSCGWTGFADADGDTDRSTTAWTVDGVAVASGDGPFALGAVIVCTVTPFDGTDTGVADSDSVTITNAAPEVTSVTITPSPAWTNDVLLATATTTDVEGDPVTLTWTWTVDGVVAGTSDTLDGATAFARDQVVEATAVPNDGHADGVAVSASLTVQNSAPSAPSVAIDPDEPVEGDDLICEVGASTDADGDSVSYTIEWDVDGTAYAGTTTTLPGDTASGTLADEVWTCTVTPDDGTDAGDAASDSVTVKAAEQRVFVTSADFSGGLGGLSGADDACQDAADTAGLGGTWVAYMSDSSTNAKDRVGDGPYVRLDGAVVATDKTDLTDGSIAVPISIDENGDTQSKWVKTGSASDGTRGTNTSTNGLCTEWTNGCGVCYGNHFYSNSGRSYDTGKDWLDRGWLFCSQGSGIYCFEK